MYLTENRRSFLIDKQNGRQKFYSSFGFLSEGFTLNETEELEKSSLPTAAFKEDTNMFSSEFREGFGL